MRKTYDKDFKLKVTKDIENGTKTVTEVANEFKISRPIVSRWLAEFNRYGKRSFSGRGNKLPNRAKDAISADFIVSVKCNAHVTVLQLFSMSSYRFDITG